MGGNLELTTLPEWSDFFRSLVANRCLRVRWKEEDGEWTAQAYEHSTDLSKPLHEVMLGPRCTGSDKFEVLSEALETCERKIGEAVWTAFYRFRAAATGQPTDIEDLL